MPTEYQLLLEILYDAGLLLVGAKFGSDLPVFFFGCESLLRIAAISLS